MNSKEKRNGKDKVEEVKLLHLRELREKKGLTQKELADVFNFQPSTISNYENNEHAPSLTTLVRFAEYFHVSIEYLLGMTDSPEPLEGMLSQKYHGDVTLAQALVQLLEINGDVNRGATMQIIRAMAAYSALPSERLELQGKKSDKSKTK